MWTSLTPEGVRGEGREKRLAKSPPVLLLDASLIDGDLKAGGGEVGVLIVLVRRKVGRVDMYGLLGSRADLLLVIVSVCKVST